MKCKFCNEQININEHFCNKCGMPISGNKSNSSFAVVPENNNRKFFCSFLIVLFLFAMCFVTYITLKSFKDDSMNINNDYIYFGDLFDDFFYDDNGIDSSKDEEFLSSLIYINEKIVNNSLYFFIENKNDVNIYGDIDIEFYDKDGKLLSKEPLNISEISSGGEIFVECYKYPSNFSSYKPILNIKELKEELNFESIEVNDFDDGIEIIADIKNVSNEKVYKIELGIIFYKDDEIVSLDYDIIYDINPNKMITYKFSYPADIYSLSNIEFDNYEIVLFSVE